MNLIVRVVVAMLIFCQTPCGLQQASAQEWSTAQKEVWKTFETYHAVDVAQDLDKFMAYVHDDYLGWWNRDPLPQNKAEIREFLAHEYKTSKVVLFTIKPVGIRVHGDSAFVHYYWKRVSKSGDGPEKIQRGRWTDILVKKEGKWLLIGDHGGPENGEPE